MNNKENEKGFAIIGILVIAVVLSAIIGTSAYFFKKVNSKDKYESLIDNIVKASEAYYLECVSTGRCTYDSEVSIETLVEKGYLAANSSDKVVNPLTNESMTDCVLSIEYKNDKVVISSKTTKSSCPQESDLKTSNLSMNNTEVVSNEEIMYGDINDDDKVNLKDLVIMVQYINGLYNGNIDTKVADLNEDNIIDDIDLAILKGYVAGWDIDLPYDAGDVYNITYNLNGGKESTKNITRYAEISLPYTLYEPTREGYTFIGWTGSNGTTPTKNLEIKSGTTGDQSYTANWVIYGDANSDGSVNGKDIMIMTKYVNGTTDVNINLNAADVNEDGKVDDIDVSILTKYSAGWNITLPYDSGKSYSIIYDLQGGTVANRNITRYADITLPYTLYEPTREGYVFTGWTGSNGTTPQKDLVLITGTTGNKKYVANWIKYGDANSDGNVNGKDSIVVAKYVGGATNTNINLNAADVNADGKVDDVDSTILSKYLTGHDITLPYNSGNSYSISYNLNGGKETTRNITVYGEISLPYTINEPTREGYVFAGWTGSNGTTPQKSITITSGTTGNKTYTANWVIYGDVNSDSKINSKDSILLAQYISGKSVSINQTAADLNTDGKIDDVDSTILLKYLAGHDIKLPYNSGNTYSITYDLNGGKETTRNITKYAELSLPYTLYEPTREGYVFTGWTGSNGTTPQKSITITSGTTGNKAYTANWVMYGDVNSDGSINGKDSILLGQYISGKKVSINQTAADVNTDGKIDDVDSTILLKYLSDHDITLPYSTGNTYSITYNLNGGKETTRNITKYAEASLPYTLYEPTKEGYAFAGWTGSNGTTAQKNITITSGTTGNKTYTANWVLYGDANGDGKVSGKDSIIISQYINGRNVNINLAAADVNADGKVDSTDAEIITNYLAGNISSLPQTK